MQRYHMHIRTTSRHANPGYGFQSYSAVGVEKPKCQRLVKMIFLSFVLAVRQVGLIALPDYWPDVITTVKVAEVLSVIKEIGGIT